MTSLNKRLRGLGMPIFIDRVIFDYLFTVRAYDKYRKGLRKVFRGYDVLPYMYGSSISFDVEIKPTKLITKNETINLEWRLSSEDGNQLYSHNSIPITVTKNDSVNKVINMGYLSHVAQYKLDFIITRGNDVSEITRVADFTIKDRDNFYETFWWLLVGAGMSIIAGVIGLIIGLIIR